MMEARPTLLPAEILPVNAVIYEYGARLDPASAQLVHDQLFQAHTLYNTIVACMREVLTQVHQVLLDIAGEDAVAIQARLDAMEEAWKAAKVANDEELLKHIAADRREARGMLWALLSKARKAASDQLKPLYARIGRSAACETYQLRSQAVAEGLGWATANATLDAALNAWKKTIKRGQAPQFARFAERQQQALTLQFTIAGGVPANKLLAGQHAELVLAPDLQAGRRRYGEFQFRLGAAKANSYACGTWQYHRPLPEDAYVGFVRLIARRHANKTKYALQFMVKTEQPITLTVPAQREPLVALHLGWAAGENGRRIAGLAHGADPGFAETITLPVDIEQDIERAAQFQSRRDEARDVVVPLLKDIDAALDEDLATELAAVRKLPPQHVSQRRLARLATRLLDADIQGDVAEALRVWRSEDRKAWQASFGLARRARNRRKEFYKDLAAQLVSRYRAIVIEFPDLEKAAKKLDDTSGEKSEFTKAARAGRTLVALYELKLAIQWACARTNTPLLLLEGESTVTRCPYCGGSMKPMQHDWQLLSCEGCDAESERKRVGAANAWRMAEQQVDTMTAQFHAQVEASYSLLEATRKERLAKVAEARSRNRAVNSEQGTTG